MSGQSDVVAGQPAVPSPAGVHRRRAVWPSCRRSSTPTSTSRRTAGPTCWPPPRAWPPGCGAPACWPPAITATQPDLWRALTVREGLRALARDGGARLSQLDRAAGGAAVELRMTDGGELGFIPAPGTGTSAGRWACCWRSPRWRWPTAAGRGSRCAPASTAGGRSTTARATARDAGARWRYAGDAPRRVLTTGATPNPWRCELRGLTAPLELVAARARRRPGRWAAPALGLALAVAFAAAVATEATIAGDRAARATLAHVSPLTAAVSVVDTEPERSPARRHGPPRAAAAAPRWDSRRRPAPSCSTRCA